MSDQIWSSKACSRPRGAGWREGAQVRTRGSRPPRPPEWDPREALAKSGEERSRKRRDVSNACRHTSFTVCRLTALCRYCFFFLEIEGLWQPCVKRVYQCHFSNRLRWWWTFFSNKVFLIKVCILFFRHDGIAYLIDYSINFICAGKPEHLWDSLCESRFTAVAWDRTCHTPEVCLHPASMSPVCLQQSLNTGEWSLLQ